MRSLSVGLMVAGVLLVAVSMAGMLGAFRGAPAGAVATPGPSGVAAASPTAGAGPTGSAPASAAATPSPTSAVSPTVGGSPTPNIVHQLVARFMLDLAEAIRTGNAAFLEEHLDPRVRVRYAPADCTRYIAGVSQPAYRVEVEGVAGPAPWAWETDGRSQMIPDTFTARVRVTQDGTSFTAAEAHVTIGDGIVRWFTDCGTPVG